MNDDIDHTDDTEVPGAAPAPDASEDFEALVARQKKQRLLRLGIGLGLLVAAAGGIAIWVATRPDPKCTDPEDVDFFVNDRQLPAAAVGKVCTFPKPLDDALEATLAAPPGYGDILVSQAIVDEPTLLTDVCPGGVDGLIEAGTVAHGRKVSVFLDHCDISGTDISESSARSSDLHLVVLAVAVYGALEDSDGADAGRLANRVLAGP